MTIHFLSDLCGLADLRTSGLKKYICRLPMARQPNFKTYYMLAIMIGLAVGIATEDKYIGYLVAIALVLTVGGMRQRYRQRQQ